MKTLLLLPILCSAFIGSSYAGDWKNTVNLGSTVAKGNSDSALVSLGFSTEKKDKEDEYAANLTYTYGEDAGETSSDELLGDARWNHLFSDRFYSGLRVDLRTDALADIDFRVTLSSVFGYYLIKNEKTTLAVEGGVGISSEQVESIYSGFWSAYVGQRFEHKFDDKTRFYQKISTTAPIDEMEDFSFVGEVGIETFLSDSLSLKIYIQDKFENQPATGLKKNDFKLVTGITYRF